jgi:hypothetical protein
VPRGCGGGDGGGDSNSELRVGASVGLGAATWLVPVPVLLVRLGGHTAGKR